MDSFATVADVTEDGRLDRAIAVNICEVIEQGGDRKEASLLIEDLTGNRCPLNIWRTHDIDVTWQVDHWYVLEEVRGKVWTTEHRLSSTGDLRVSHAGTDRPSWDDTGGNLESTDESGTDKTESDDILEEVAGEFESLLDMEDS